MAKKTKKEYFTDLLTIVENSTLTDEGKAEYRAWIDDNLEQLNRKSSKNSPTKTQKENVAVMATIENALREVGKPVTVTELQASNADVAQYSNQKISALLRQMPNVVKTSDKKKSYFSLAD